MSTVRHAPAPDTIDVDFSRPPVPSAYVNLRTGPDFSLEYEQESTSAVDGSMSYLRTLSPFVIRVEPPAVYASDPAIFNGATPNPAGIYEAGKRGAINPWASARTNIQTEVFGSETMHGKSVEDYVGTGSHRPNHAGSHNGDGTVSVRADGDGPGRLGTPIIADLYTAVDIAMQLRVILTTPPLVLLINPTSLSLNFTKVQQYGDRTRYGFVFQAWGEEQPKLSVSARCGAFVSGARGVQFASRRDSASWQNLMTAFQFYKNNGYLHDTIGKSNAHHFVGALSIRYDGWIYYGNMESFTFTNEETNTLGGVTFEMEFTVAAMVDTAGSSTVVPAPSRDVSSTGPVEEDAPAPVTAPGGGGFMTVPSSPPAVAVWTPSVEGRRFDREVA